MQIGGPRSKIPRMPTLIGVPSPFTPKPTKLAYKLTRISKNTMGKPKPPVILSQMKKGGTRLESYHYLDRFTLKLNITCDKPGKVYSIDVTEVNFSERPQFATIKFIGNQDLLTSPARLVVSGKLMPKPSVSIILNPSIEKLIVEIEIEGSSALPRLLTATIRNWLPRKT